MFCVERASVYDLLSVLTVVDLLFWAFCSLHDDFLIAFGPNGGLWHREYHPHPNVLLINNSISSD